MPNYSFQCPKNHIFISNVSYETMKKGIKCQFSNGKKCKAKAFQIYLSKNEQRHSVNFQPALFFLHDNGEVITPGRNDINHLPKNYLKKLEKQGFKEVEIENIRQYQEFVNKVDSRNREKAAIYDAMEQNQYDSEIRNQISKLKSGGNIDFPNPDGSIRTVKIPPLSEMHPQARAFAEIAIKNALNFKHKSEGSQSIIGCFEYDGKLPNSDISSYEFRDQDTNWKTRRQ